MILHLISYNFLIFLRSSSPVGSIPLFLLGRSFLPGLFFIFRLLSLSPRHYRSTLTNDPFLSGCLEFTILGKHISQGPNISERRTEEQDSHLLVTHPTSSSLLSTMRSTTILLSAMCAATAFAAPAYPEFNVNAASPDAADDLSNYFNTLASKVSSGKQMASAPVCDLSNAVLPTTSECYHQHKTFRHQRIFVLLTFILQRRLFPT